jgi:hypothetical protein
MSSNDPGGPMQQHAHQLTSKRDDYPEKTEIALRGWTLTSSLL